MDSDILSAALDYAARGWSVLPLEPGGKRPAGRLAPHGLKDATTDAAVLTAWWAAEPTANIGLRTGESFDVLDIDGPAALDALEGAGPPAEVRMVDGAAVCADDIEGPTVATPRGWHVYVAPTGRGNTVNLAGLPGVDWRGVGGYVVVPPSTKPDGTAWEWLRPSGLDLGPDTPIRPAPAWVLALFDRREAPATAPVGSVRHEGRTGYGAAALERECGRLAVAVEGERNDQLNRSAHSLGKLVASRDLDAEEAGCHLLRVAIRIGLGEPEAIATIKSGLAAGVRSPRRRR